MPETVPLENRHPFRFHGKDLPGITTLGYRMCQSPKDNKSIGTAELESRPGLAEDDEASLVGRTLLTRLASSTLAAPTDPSSSNGLYVMDLNVCQVVVGLSVVLKTAPGLRALMSRSTSHT